ncbi:MAG TPA: hypothetical protein VN408_07505 [Actinoplanes sp.]|nr:hypothetical protein [Actinoplanes sp.]
MTDELDLVGELGHAEPLRPEAYERARTVLRAAMQDPGTVRLLGTNTAEKRTTMEKTASRRRRGFGIGAGVGVAAAAAAVVALTLGNTSAPGGAVAGAETPAVVVETTGDAPLMLLAGSIKTLTQSEGDAWLVTATKSQGEVVVTLYTDDHAIYSGNNVGDIKRAIKLGQDQFAESGNAPLLKAAIAAADLEPAEGRVRMLEASGNRLVGLDPAAQQKKWDEDQAEAAKRVKARGGTYQLKPFSAEAVERHFDNSVWAYGTQALSAGEGNTQVRSGVLRLLSTIDAVEVAKSTTDGIATLTLTAGPAVFGGQGDEVLTVNATTGMLVKRVSTVPGLPTATTTYETSRVTAAQL